MQDFCQARAPLNLHTMMILEDSTRGSVRWWVEEVAFRGSNGRSHFVNWMRTGGYEFFSVGINIYTCERLLSLHHLPAVYTHRHPITKPSATRLPVQNLTSLRNSKTKYMRFVTDSVICAHSCGEFEPIRWPEF